MTTPTSASACNTEQHIWPISQLQGDAWAAFNAAYGTHLKDAYHEVGRALYAQDVHDRIQSLLTRSDEQNARLDALLAQRHG